MISDERILTVLRIPHISEKSSSAMEKDNTVVFKVIKNATKAEIKNAVQKLFEVKVEDVNTLIIKGKVKRYKQYKGKNSSWKKAYVTIKKGENLDFLSGRTE